MLLCRGSVFSRSDVHTTVPLMVLQYIQQECPTLIFVLGGRLYGSPLLSHACACDGHGHGELALFIHGRGA